MVKMLKIKAFEELNSYYLHICDINNSFMVRKDLYDKLCERNEISSNELLDLLSDICSDRIAYYEHILEGFEKIDLDTEVTESSVSNFTICLHPVRKCNLRCRYCFGSEEYLPKQELDIAVAKKAIEYFVYDYAKDAKMYTIDLAGSGEPLLRFEFIKELEAYCRSLRNKIGKKIIISFPTNATLLEAKHIDYFSNHGDILYGISLDGNKPENRWRVYPNGKECFEDTMRGIKITENPHCGFAVTLTHQNENVDEVYDYLYSLNKGDAISMHPVRDFSDGDTSFFNIDIDNLIMHYRQLVHNFINKMKEQNFDYVKPLLNGDDIFGGYIKQAFGKGTISKYRCDAGRNRFAVNEEGNIYACSVMNGEDYFRVGNLDQGISEQLQAKFSLCSITANNDCKKCWASSICTGECMAISYLNSGKLYTANKFFCTIRRELAKLAIAFVEYIKTYDERGYSELRSFLLQCNYYMQTDPAVWIIIKYLAYHGYSVEYKDIIMMLDQYEEKNNIIGVSISTVEKLISRYIKDVCAVAIEKSEDLSAVKEPIIGCLINNNCYDYYWVECDENGKLRVETMYSTEKRYFLNDNLIKMGFNLFIGPFSNCV